MGTGLRHEKAEMLLRLASMMQATRAGISLHDMMDEFGLSRRTVERMRDAVERVFPQMEEVAEDGRIKRWRIPPRTLSGMIDCTPDQLASLDLAIKVFENDGRKDKARDLQQIDAIIKGSMRPEKLGRIEPDIEALTLAEGIAIKQGPRPELSVDVIGDLRAAIIGMHEVSIRYRSRETGKLSSQILQPYGFLYGRKSYLVACGSKTKSMRLWLISNIESVEIQYDLFSRDPDFDLKSYAANSFGVFQEEPIDVELLFESDVAKDVLSFHFHPTQCITLQLDGRVRVTFRAGGAVEICWHLFTWGPCVEIVGPASLKEKLQSMCRAFI